MRRVRVKYTDGRVVEYDMLRDAAKALHVAADTLVAFSNGRAANAGRRLHAAGIESVVVDAQRPPRLDRPVWESRGRPVAVIATCKATGETRRYVSMLQASISTGVANSTIKDGIGDGHYHSGWRFDMDEDAPPPVKAGVTFGDTPVPEDYLIQFRAMALHYLGRHWHGFDRQDMEDAAACAVEAAAALYSRGKYNPARCTFGVWAYKNVKCYAAKEMRRIAKWRDGRVAPPDSIDPDIWMDMLIREDADETVLDEDYVAGLPEQYRPLAALILAGKTRYEICAELGLTHSQLDTRRKELGAYIRARAAGSDSGE